MTLLSSLLTQNLTAASGVNVCTSPNTATGWFSSASPAAATTTSPSELPLLGAILSGIKFTKTVVGDYDAWRWQMPPALKNMPFPISWYQLVESGFASGDVKVDVYTYPDATYTNAAKTRKPLRSDASSVTGVPAGTGFFGAGNAVSFDALSEDWYEMRVTRVAGTKYLVFTNLKIGPGDNGAAASQGIYETVNTFTIGAITTPPTPGTGATFLRETYKDGSFAVIRYEFRQAAAGTSGSGDYLFPLPAGLSIDYSRVSTTSSTFNGYVGTGVLQNGSTFRDLTAYVVNSGAYANKICFDVTNDALAHTNWSGTVDALSNTTIVMSINVRVPIIGWTDSVLVAAGNAIEYASGAITSDANVTTGITNSPAGSSLPTAALSSSRYVEVTWSTPRTNDDTIDLEVEVTGGTTNWLPHFANNNGSFAYSNQASVDYGMFLVHVSSTVSRIYFCRYYQPSTTGGTTYGSAGLAWTGISGRWRAKKFKSTMPAGLPYGQLDGSAQLYKAGYVPGYTGGTPTTGMIGEKITGTTQLQSLVTTTRANVGQITLTPGNWLIVAQPVVSGNSVTGTRSYAELALSTSGTGGFALMDTTLVPSSTADIRTTLSGFISVTVNTTVYLNALMNFSAATSPNANCLKIEAVRIA